MHILNGVCAYSCINALCSLHYQHGLPVVLVESGMKLSLFIPQGKFGNYLSNARAFKTNIVCCYN